MRCAASARRAACCQCAHGSSCLCGSSPATRGSIVLAVSPLSPQAQTRRAAKAGHSALESGETRALGTLPPTQNALCQCTPSGSGSPRPHVCRDPVSSFLHREISDDLLATAPADFQPTTTNSVQTTVAPGTNKQTSLQSPPTPGEHWQTNTRDHGARPLSASDQAFAGVDAVAQLEDERRGEETRETNLKVSGEARKEGAEESGGGGKAEREDAWASRA
eukprot:2078298-Rhodomonas_salina.1